MVRYLLKNYFDYIESRLNSKKVATLNHLNLIKEDVKDYGIYGEYLSRYISQNQVELFGSDDPQTTTLVESTTKRYSSTLQRYLDFIPKDLVMLRQNLCQSLAANTVLQRSEYVKSLNDPTIFIIQSLAPQ